MTAGGIDVGPRLLASPRQILHCGVLTRRHGAPAEIPYQLRVLGPDDRDALVAFRDSTFAGLPDPDAYVPEVAEFVDWHLGGDRGHTLGVFADNALAACAVLGVPQARMPNFAADLPEPRPALDRVAHMASSMVDPAYRGNGLQRNLVAVRTLLALGLGRPDLLTRVAFTNPVSLANMLACGFAIRAVLVMHGDRLRYLMHRALAVGPWECVAGSEVVLPADDVDGQRAALADGLIGIGGRRRPDGTMALIYARPMATPDGDAGREQAPDRFDAGLAAANAARDITARSSEQVSS